jgi:DNA-binding NtrC family response regulator
MAAGSSLASPLVRPATTATGAGPVEQVLLLGPGGRQRPGVLERVDQVCGPVLSVSSLSEALRHLAVRRFELCVLDLAGDQALPATVRLLQAQHPALPLIGIVDPVTPLIAGEAVQAGLTDVLPWPFEARDLAMVVANVRDRISVPIDDPASGASGPAPIFGQSPAMRQTLAALAAAALGRSGVCLVGEPATGRGLLARTVHALASGEGDRPFVAVDCGADTPQQIERRLFGVEGDRRSASDHAAAAPAVGDEGAIVAARGGTLYLTRLTELPARVQVGLARLLRDREATLADRRTVIDLDVRPVAALDATVDGAVEDGQLRADLYERFSQTRIDVPPLRRRKEDIPLLAAWFLTEACREAGVSPRRFTRAALALLGALPWHGNAGELRGVIDAAVRASRRPVVQIEDLLEQAGLDGMSARFDTRMTLREARARFERECISAVLRRHHGRVGEAAKALGIQRTNLYRKVRQLNVSRSLLSARR